jgi:hypothetical protein
MKVMAIQIAENKGVNVEPLLHHALAELELQGIETLLVRFDGASIKSCSRCSRCFLKGNRCSDITGDPAEECLLDIIGTDAVIIAFTGRIDPVIDEFFSIMDEAELVAAKPDLSDILHDREKARAANDDIGIVAFDMNRRFVYVKYVSSLNNGNNRDPGYFPYINGETVMRDLGFNLSLVLKNFKSIRKEPFYGKNSRQFDGSYRQYAAA